MELRLPAREPAHAGLGAAAVRRLPAGAARPVRAAVAGLRLAGVAPLGAAEQAGDAVATVSAALVIVVGVLVRAGERAVMVGVAEDAETLGQLEACPLLAVPVERLSESGVREAADRFVVDAPGVIHARGPLVEAVIVVVGNRADMGAARRADRWEVRGESDGAPFADGVPVGGGVAVGPDVLDAEGNGVAEATVAGGDRRGAPCGRVPPGGDASRADDDADVARMDLVPHPTIPLSLIDGDDGAAAAGRLVSRL